MSIANVGNELKNMQPAVAGNTTMITPIFESKDGIVIAYSQLTASAALTALVANGVKFAPGCLCICVHSDAVATVYLMANYGIATAPDFYSVITAGVAG